MSQKHKSKKTLLSPDEKLWRRISSKFGKDEDKWDMVWNSSKIYSFFVEKEKLKLDNKESKQLKSKIDEILAHSKKKRQWFLYKQNNEYVLRKPKEISEIENPFTGDKPEWANKISHCQWSLDEFESGECWEHVSKSI